ncbi:MAG: hypothetical protein R3E39_23665 [Anaerolineae bacterium]
MTPKIIDSAAHRIQSSCITTLRVQQALDRLISTTGVTSPLCDLCVVDYLLTDTVTFASVQAKEQALSDILVSFITYELLEQRAKFHLPPPDSKTTVEQVEAAIVTDTQTRNIELIGMSYLYYRYVCSVKHVSSDWFAAVTSLDENALTVCYDNAIGWLTQKIRDEELVASNRRFQDRLTASLPSLLQTELEERCDDFVRIMRWLSAPVRHHAQVVGQAGIGKTTFVCEVAKRLVEMDRIDDFIWIENAYSVGEIQQGFRGIQQNGSIRKLNATNRMLYVFDNFICPGDEWADFGALLDYLRSSIVIVTTRSSIPTLHAMEHIALS